MPHQHLRTLSQLFAHPTSHNIHWRDVIHLFNTLGGTTEQTKHDHLKVKFTDREMTFPIPRGSGSTLQSDHEISAIPQGVWIRALGTLGLTRSKGASLARRLLLGLQGAEDQDFRRSSRD